MDYVYGSPIQEKQNIESILLAHPEDIEQIKREAEKERTKFSDTNPSLEQNNALSPSVKKNSLFSNFNIRLPSFGNNATSDPNQIRLDDDSTLKQETLGGRYKKKTRKLRKTKKTRKIKKELLYGLS